MDILCLYLYYQSERQITNQIKKKKLKKDLVKRKKFLIFVRQVRKISINHYK